MRLAQILFSQGFGTRRACEGLAAAGLVAIGGVVRDDPFEDLEPEGLVLTVEGGDWPYHAKALVALNKPAGYECSRKPRHHASVYSLLPAPLLRRDVQAVGRLDEDTTGLLLFTDDGQLLHRWTSPRHHVPKVYDVSCRHAVTDEQLERLRAGVVLQDDPEPVRALAAESWNGAAAGLHGVRLTLAEGKYHQVKRMMAAVGNRVEALHRSRFGRLELPADLAPGTWCWLPGTHVVAG
ncbi:MAG TPA: 16S rRNA pseudouridine(516) synthase [Burkholderiaceae bacterium]